MPLHDTISPFGGFAPFPNSIMVPVMGLQSDVIGFRFGFGYEKGKRTLRAMSNEQFNALDHTTISNIYKEHDSIAINYFQNEMGKFIELQNLIIEKTVEIEMAKARRTPSATAEIIGSFYDGVRNLGKQAGTSGFTWQRLASLLFPFLFSNQEHEHPEDIPIPPPDPNAGGRSPGGKSPQEPDTPETEPEAPKDTPTEPTPPPNAPTAPGPAPTPEIIPPGKFTPSPSVFFTQRVYQYDSSNAISNLKVSNLTFNLKQWETAFKSWETVTRYLKNRQSGRTQLQNQTGVYLQNHHTFIVAKVQAFYQKPVHLGENSLYKPNVNFRP